MLTKNTLTIRKCKAVLEQLLEEQVNTYIDLFFYEKEVAIKKEWAVVLERAGIVKKRASLWQARVMVCPFREKFIVTDFLLSHQKKKGDIFVRSTDDVWVMYPFETLAFIKRLDADLKSLENKNKIVLDLASGSGAISLFLAESFKKVVSADRNPKAVRYARFNAILNGLETKITNIETDIFSQFKGEKFDYIVWNGPTGPLPKIANPEIYYPQYYYGGSDGAEFTIKFLQQVFNHVTPDFKIKFLDASLGTCKCSVTEEFISTNLQGLPIEIKIEFLNIHGKKPLRDYLKLYNKYCLSTVPMNIKKDKKYEAAYANWKKELKERKLYYFYFANITIVPAKKFKIVHTYPQESSFLPRHEYGFDWHFANRKYIKEFIKNNVQKG